MKPAHFFQSTFGMILVISVLTLSAYSFMLQESFETLDDEVSIVKNPLITSFSHLPEIFQTSFFEGNAYYRPLVTTSFMVEYHFFGLNAYYYYLTNMLIHLCTAISVLFLMNFIFNNRTIAFFVSLLFAIHPVQWEAVSNIPGRSILLCACFYINAFLFFCLSQGRSGKAVNASPAKEENSGRCLYYMLSLIFFTLALLSKESATVFPILLISYTFFFRNRLVPVMLLIRQLIGSVAPFFIILGGYVLVRRHLEMTHLFYWRSTSESLLGFMTFLRAMMSDVRLFILPVDLHFDRMRHVFTNFFDPELLGTLFFFLMFSFFIYRSRKKLSKEVLFFLSWFFIELMPVSQILVTIGVQPGYISVAEHFLYTPSVGMLVLLVLSFRWIFEFNARRNFVSSNVLKSIAGGFCGFFFLTTIQQNIYTSNERAMFLQTLHFDPDNTRVRNALALAYARDKLFKEAETEFRKILRFDPLNTRARIGLGKALCDQGKFLAGTAEYEKVRDPGGLKKLLDTNRHLTYQILVGKYQKMIEHNPQDPAVYYSLGVIYSKMQEHQAAVEQYKKAVDLQPDFSNALFNLASSLEAMGDLEQSRSYYQKFLSLPEGKDKTLTDYAEIHVQLIIDLLSIKQNAKSPCPPIDKKDRRADTIGIRD